MRLLKPTCEIIPQKPGVDGVYQQIEIAGRTCYKSDNKITADSAFRFVDNLIRNKHFAMLEHGTVYLTVIDDNFEMQHDLLSPDVIGDYQKNKFSIVNSRNEVAYITTNLRVLLENDWLEDLQYLCEPTEYHEKRITVRFGTQIAISREFNRHRINSMAEQSTIYCNYSTDKFNSSVGVNEPSFIEDLTAAAYKISEDVTNDPDAVFEKMCAEILKFCPEEYAADTSWGIIDWWLFGNLASERSYIEMLKLGAKPHQARTVLPLDTHTELVHTASESGWRNFLYLRDSHSTGFQHPDAEKLALKLKNLLAL